MTRFELVERKSQWGVTDGPSCIRWRRTRAEAEELLRTIEATPPCRECSEPIGLVRDWWMEPYGSRLAERQLCFECNFWLGHVRRRNGIVIKGRHYIPSSDQPTVTHAKGFGGQRFKIRMADGQIIETDNLWTQGAIPKRFRGRLPDNAEFLEPAP